jgi:hypothetical protein
MWDVNTMEKKQKNVMKAKTTAGRRVGKFLSKKNDLFT